MFYGLHFISVLFNKTVRIHLYNSKFVALLQCKKLNELIILVNGCAIGVILIDFVSIAILFSSEITPLLSIIVIINIAYQLEVWEIEGKYAAVAHI